MDYLPMTIRKLINIAPRTPFTNMRQEYMMGC